MQIIKQRLIKCVLITVQLAQSEDITKAQTSLRVIILKKAEDND